MPELLNKLDLLRCPHCNIDKPNLNQAAGFESCDHASRHKRAWRVYICDNCGGAVIAAANAFGKAVLELYPSPRSVDDAIPVQAKAYLSQAIQSLHAPAGAVMLAASAVDSMLKAKGYKDGSLYSRIDKAASDHLITSEMAKWAHQVRLDANEQRHADESDALPDTEDAQRSVDFASALGAFMFVFPNRVEAGLAASQTRKAKRSS
jgi:hypothetical protein